MEEGGISVEGTTTIPTTTSTETIAQEQAPSSLQSQVMIDSTNCVRPNVGTIAPVSMEMHKSSDESSSSSSSSPASTASSSHIGSIKYTNGNGSDGNNSKGVNHHAMSELQLRQALSQQQQQGEGSGDQSNNNNNNKGLLASGLGWLQRKREERRRQQLQQQADLQLKKILEAQQTLHRIQSKESEDMSCDNQNNNNIIGASERSINTQKSQSGEGASGQIELDLQDEEEEDDFYVPEVRLKPEAGTPRPTILNQLQMNQIASLVLPQTISFCRWNRLYDLGRDGDSFDGCLRIVSETKRTLLVVRTTKGEIFGGFADAAWATQQFASAKFYGGASACLFKVLPNDEEQPIRPYKWSGKNRYIQLCDTSRKMLAFGGGGDGGAFGLAVEEDFQRGSTGHCDTFDNEPLCEDGSFEIVDLEIWEFLTGMF